MKSHELPWIHWKNHITVCGKRHNWKCKITLEDYMMEIPARGKIPRDT